MPYLVDYIRCGKYQAGGWCMHGWVRNFVVARGFGFITGDDGQDYFFHLDDVTGHGAPSTGQAVSFTPGRTAKGLRARSVAVSGRTPQGRPVYIDPDHFIMTRAPEVRGFIIVRVLSHDAWGESNDPNEAKDILRQQAERLGANAIVGLALTKYTKNETCSNYRYTMHRFTGRAVVVKKAGYSFDPEVIARTQEGMRDTGGDAAWHSVGRTSLVRPPLWRFVPMLSWSLARTVLTIGAVAVRQAAAAVAVGARRSAAPAD
ncbi:cold shock domain-containing protein [Dactylosporangium sp. NPDC006015]|uniref:cold shock domain-containing protein n=1 Tax=Dactylosporangium sp. NPDC006015 TaxID=3154576 RepID=UPI0033BD19CD